MLEGFSGATRLYPIIGDPIAQVKSPSALTRAFERAGHDAIVVPVHVAPADLERLLRVLGAMRNVDGLLATIPHKFAMAEFVTTISPRARTLGSVNIVRRIGTEAWHGDMLDGVSLVATIRSNGYVLEGRQALLIGAGGAGSAVGLELLDAGVAGLAVHDVDRGRRERLIDKLVAAHPGKVRAGSEDPTGADVVVNCTPSGMAAGDAPPVRLERLDQRMLVGDLVTLPEVTPLIRAARGKGCITTTGVEMHTVSLEIMCAFFFDGH